MSERPTDAPRRRAWGKDLVIALALRVAMFVVVLYTQEQTALADNARSIPAGPELEAAQQAVKNATFHFSLIPGIAVIWLKAAVCATLTLLLS
ncbi:MAG: hypothetical protein AAFZ65_19550, partial [Planctomycetota bacterium]